MPYRLCSPLALLCLLSLTGHGASERWGATRLPPSFYPDSQWTAGFSPTPDVVAVGSIETAIDRCDVVVGVDHYCVVLIGQGTQRLPFRISRSKTKLLGSDDTPPLRSRSGEATIAIDYGVHHVVIDNLILEGHDAGHQDVYGILIRGESIHHVMISNNTIHRFHSDSNAHAIAVFGTGGSEKTANSHILIEGNDIRDMHTGSSESIAINGNVTRWAVNRNRLENINNIGIDAIGGEGTAPTTTLNGKVLPGEFDAARYGWITHNVLVNMSTSSNPAYDNQPSWAAGIYIDGGRFIHLQGNAVSNAPWAYEIGAENCIDTRHITATSNTASGSYYGDLLLGGYSPEGYRDTEAGINCNPHTSADSDEGHGYVKQLSIYRNHFSSINPLEAPVLIQYRTTGAVVIEPGVHPENADGDGSASRDENAVRVSF